MSETIEMLKDLMHMTGVALSSGRHMPSTSILSRASYEEIMEKRKLYESRKLLKRLKDQKLLKIKEKGNRIIVSITDKGKYRLLKSDVLYGAEFLSGYKVCLVSFDIPEHVRASRDVLRAFLKEADFEQVHRSVWRTKYDVVKPLKELIDNLGIGDWVKVYVANEV